ncbi:MAG: STAS domain-containing protein [Azospirillaceae bacterium]|nr:STAS domain-containing protein [Azospirillaceae bacterium]
MTSLPPDITDEHAERLQSDILERLDQTAVVGVILDITALDVVDSYMARILAETAQMTRLMGSEVVITGMNPLVAVTLIEMGRELTGVTTALTLEQGVASLKHQIAARDGDPPEDPVDECG